MNSEEFISKVQQSAALASRTEADAWATAVLVSLCHLLPDSEARRHFISQVPGQLKSHLQAEAPRALVMTRDAFLQHVGNALGTHAPQAETAVRAVYDVLKQAVSAGEIAHLEAHVPREIATLLEQVQ